MYAHHPKNAPRNIIKRRNPTRHPTSAHAVKNRKRQRLSTGRGPPSSYETPIGGPKDAHTAPPATALTIIDWRRRLRHLLLLERRRRASPGMQMVQVWRGRLRRLLQVHVAVARSAAATAAGVCLHEEQTACAAQPPGELAKAEALGARRRLPLLGRAAMQRRRRPRGETKPSPLLGIPRLQRCRRSQHCRQVWLAVRPLRHAWSAPVLGVACLRPHLRRPAAR